MGEPASLSRIFLARLGGRRASELAPAAKSIDAALSAADAAGRAAWPRVPLAAEAFADHIADRVGTRSDVEEAIRALHAADLFLACACSCGIPEALAELERVQLSRVPGLVRHIDSSPAFADEVAQVMRETFLVPAHGGQSRMAEYAGRGSLWNWVRVVAVRTALRIRREQKRATASGEAEEQAGLPGVVDPELGYLKLRYRLAYQEALEAALASLPDRDALLLKLHYVDGLNIDRIGVIFGMHRSTVARWRTSVRYSLLASTREQVRRRVSLTASEFDSLLALVRSQLVLSIRTALGRPGPSGSSAGTS